MKIEVKVRLKDGVLDPQGKAISHALNALGFKGVGEVSVGKLISLEIESSDKNAAREEVKKMCETLLANTVIENYEILD